MIDLPPDFVWRMQGLLGREAEEFFAALEGKSTPGLRVNLLKIDPDQLQRLVLWKLDSIPWCRSGFFLNGEVSPGKHAFHAAGLYYLQEPSAMAVAEAVGPQAGEWVLDLAAAPGGKTTHLCSLADDKAFVVANEIETSRTRALASNLERWGTRRSIITNETPERLGDKLGDIFDRVLVDAPCSGEGMFRKNPNTRIEWTQESVQGCSTRQGALVRTAAELVRPGGVLVYSTCTFAPEENEIVIAEFLNERDDFSPEEVTLAGSSPGRPDWVPPDRQREDLAFTARFWPHRIRGEGHFVAVLRRAGDERRKPKKSDIKPIRHRVRQLWKKFVAETFRQNPLEDMVLTMVGDQLYAVAEDVPSLRGLKVIRQGLWVGTVQRDRLEPSHSLALALRKDDANNVCDFKPDDERLEKYLQGHPLRESGESGWVLMTVSGHPISWGRRVQGTIKNVYPKGLRRPLS